MLPSQLYFHFEKITSSNQDLIVGDFNYLAYNFLQNNDNWLSNALFLYGERGVGKTILVNYFIDKYQGKILSINEIGDITKLGEIVKNNENFILENIAHLSPEQEVSLFHLYNMITNENKKLIITSCVDIKSLNIKLADLSSRLSSAVIIEIKSPNETILKSLFVKIITTKQLNINRNLIEYIFKRIPRSAITVIELCDILEHHIMTEKKTLTIPLLKNILNQIDIVS